MKILCEASFGSLTYCLIRFLCVFESFLTGMLLKINDGFLTWIVSRENIILYTYLDTLALKLMFHWSVKLFSQIKSLATLIL